MGKISTCEAEALVRLFECERIAASLDRARLAALDRLDGAATQDAADRFQGAVERYDRARALLVEAREEWEAAVVARTDAERIPSPDRRAGEPGEP